MKKQGIYLLEPGSYDRIYGPEERERIGARLDMAVPPQTAASVGEHPEVLRDVQVVMSGWGCPTMDAAFLAAAPRLEAVFYGAGSIRGVVSDAFWDRGIVITSSYAANAVPVAEYVLSHILFALKGGWPTVRHLRETHRWEHPLCEQISGAYRATVGLVSLGMVARHLCRLLRMFDLRVLAYDPFVSPGDAAELGVTPVDLNTVFAQSDLVSLHTPHLPETVGMITGRHLRLLRPGAAFINTARGAIVREPEMIEVLRARPDLIAVLDVTFPEPPVTDSPLWTLPNVVLTPHIAGSMSRECRRMGSFAADQLECYLDGKPLKWRISRELAARLA